MQADKNAGNLKTFEYLFWTAAVLFALLGAYGRSGADPAMSRLATVYSITHFSTFYIDRPLDEEPILFEQRTIDKVMVKGEKVGNTIRRGRLISSKPPVLPLLMTAEYVVMNRLLGWDLDNRDDLPVMLSWMTITLVGGAYLVTLIFFAKTAALFVEDHFTRLILLFSLAFATQFWGYSTLLNNHVPGASMVVIALYFCLGICTGKLPPTPWRFVLFGFAGALAFTLDMPSTIFVALAGIWLLFRFPHKTLLWAACGAFLPLAVHFGTTYQVTGSVFPVQIRDEVYHYEASYWRHSRGIDALNEPKGTYLFHMTFGRCGLFSLYPILLLGLASSLRAVFKKSMPHRSLILAGALGFAVFTAYYAVTSNNYGGEAYGFRWYIPAMPVLLLMGAPLLPRLHSTPWRFFLAVIIAISFYSAWESSRVGWRANQEWTCRFLGPCY